MKNQCCGRRNQSFLFLSAESCYPGHSSPISQQKASDILVSDLAILSGFRALLTHQGRISCCVQSAPQSWGLAVHDSTAVVPFAMTAIRPSSWLRRYQDGSMTLGPRSWHHACRTFMNSRPELELTPAPTALQCRFFLRSLNWMDFNWSRPALKSAMRLKPQYCLPYMVTANYVPSRWNGQSFPYQQAFSAPGQRHAAMCPADAVPVILKDNDFSTLSPVEKYRSRVGSGNQAEELVTRLNATLRVLSPAWSPAASPFFSYLRLAKQLSPVKTGFIATFPTLSSFP